MSFQFLCGRFSILLLITLSAHGQDRISFVRDIEPIFTQSCWKCHGAAIQLAKLDLRTRESALKGGEHGAALVPGDAERSRLYRAVAGLDKPRMPMDGALAPEQIARIRDWINQGAHWEGDSAKAAESASAGLAALEEIEIPDEARRYWAFQPIRRPRPPDTASHPIDAFLQQVRREKDLKPAPLADRRTLLRRAYLDLTGLPPTRAEIADFLNDDSPQAWERLIDRLLDSPHYGERWGRHWLDVARYADSNGYEHDFDRPNAWRYRDYVIRSFNRDTPFNVFLQEQIAGDELDWVSYDSLIATGFLRNHAKVGFREKDNPQFRYEYLDDMIATIGRGILGLTVQCARCHNHKFDPIPQKDYYRLQSSLFGYVEVDHPLVSEREAERHARKIAEIEARLEPLRREIREIEQPYRDRLLPAKYKRFPENVQIAINTPEAERTPGQKLLASQIILTTRVSEAEIDRVITPEDRARKQALAAQIAEIERQRPAPIPVAMGITDGDYRFAPDGPGDEPAPGKGVKQEVTDGSYLFKGPGRYTPPPSYFLFSGDIHSRGSQMQPGFLTIASRPEYPTELPPAHGRTSGRRRALAEWLTAPDNPLPARVIVNRIWHHHFGRGIVATLDDFGKNGERPTHPELLDWLASEFMTRGWSFKQMHRLIMTSDAYRMASQFESPENAAIDPENRYLWRYRLQRLEAEIVRDSILAVSGGLNREMGGPPIFPKISEEVLATMKNGIWKQGDQDGPDTWRRSVYVYRKRGLPFPMFQVFDLPDQNTSCGRRNVSTVPTQALTLLNNEFVLEHARLLAGRIREEARESLGAQIDTAYELVLARPPDQAERGLALTFLERNSLEDFAHVLLNLNEFLYAR
ncbi:MAG: PSD1 and planctomycete cytochrome C domain-containing protein [Bryobacteraceae bacterium]